VTDAKPYRHRFPMSIIQHAVWLYHRFPLRVLASLCVELSCGKLSLSLPLELISLLAS